MNTFLPIRTKEEKLKYQKQHDLLRYQNNTENISNKVLTDILKNVKK